MAIERTLAPPGGLGLPQRGWARRPLVLAAATLLAAALLLRFPQFGNAIAGLDEQYYLLVGDRMWHGAVPYVDLWDRKPFGLFALFAAIRLLPGDGVLAAQLVATVAAAATGLVIARIAGPRTGWVPATMAGIFYVAGLNELWGDTTQTPVFYNLPVALAAFLTLRAAADPLAHRREALAAMLLAGLAIQIKTNALFEGALFGAWLVGGAWLRTRSLAGTARFAALLALAGAAPTLAAMAGYAAIGEFPAWWQANVTSVIAKGAPQDANAVELLKGSFVLMTPAALVALLGLWARTRRFTEWDADTAFLIAWSLVAIADFTAIGGYFPHYAIPLLLASAPLIAHGFAIPRLGPALFAATMAWPAIHVGYAVQNAAVDRANAARVVAALPADVTTECMFIYEGPVAYYHLGRACLVSRYAFTAHLSSAREAHALGVDPAAELAALMARRPGTVLTVARSTWTDRNPAMERELAGLLAGRYRPVAALPHRYYAPDERLIVWRRNDLQ